MSTNDTFSQKPVTFFSSDSGARTLVFVGVAAVCLILTGIIEWALQPAVIAEYGKMGEKFYEDFDPTTATSLEVFGIDPEELVLQDFSVKRLENGRWVIPSHHDYPADAVEKLAKTAASMIGIKRGAMVTRWPADHAQYGVVDPMRESLAVKDVEGVGKHIILRGEDDTPLADLIIGNEADQPGQYYVRAPDEDEVYIADLDIDLSTKFSDWINTDLLELEAANVREVTLNDRSFDGQTGRVSPAVATTLTRESGSDPWEMDGLNDETQEVNADAMRETVSTLADLSIVGVRPKREGVTPDLKIDTSVVRNNIELDILQRDLIERGFALVQEPGGAQDQLQLVSAEGELLTASDKGLSYRLYFGRAFTGNQKELEIGLQQQSDEPEGEAADEKEDDEKANNESDDSDDSTGENSDGDDTSDDGAATKPGRYVFVRVEFDDTYLGDKPVKPVEPEEPPELKQAEDGDAGAKEEPKQEGEGEEGDTEQDPVEKARQEYEAAKAKYESDLIQFEQDLEAYNTKVDEAKEKAEEMNRRFAEWYYVIPGESFDKLRLARADLLKPKEEDTEGGGAAAGPPGIPGMPGMTVPPNMAPGGGVMSPPAKTEPAKTEPAKTEPAKTEPAKTEPAKTEPAKTEPAKTEPAKTEPAKTEPAKTEPAKTEPAKTEPAKTEPAKTEPAKTEPAKTEPAKTEPAKTEPAGKKEAAASGPSTQEATPPAKKETPAAKEASSSEPAKKEES